MYQILRFGQLVGSIASVAAMLHGHLPAATLIAVYTIGLQIAANHRAPGERPC